MCVVSNVMDDFSKRWQDPFPFAQPNPFTWTKELDKFKEELEKAAQTDIKEGNPDCGTKDKIDKLLQLSREFGIEDKVKKILRETLGLE